MKAISGFWYFIYDMYLIVGRFLASVYLSLEVDTENGME